MISLVFEELLIRELIACFTKEFLLSFGSFPIDILLACSLEQCLVIGGSGFCCFG